MADGDPIKTAAEIIKRIRVSSVLSSLLWVLAVLILAIIVTSFSGNVAVLTFFMWLAGIDFTVIIICFTCILSFGDPRLLQSEDHMYRMKALEVIGDQGHTMKALGKMVTENNPELPDPKTVEIPKIEEANTEKSDE